MGALDAFYSTWSDARETFGQGTPQDGGQLDNSSKLMQMQAGVEAAAPDTRWQGPASEAYAAKNKEHAGVYGRLAELDKKMAAEVANAANVVTTGRQNLDVTKSWVDSVAASIPPGTTAADRDSKLLTIANEGIGKVSKIVTDSTNAMTAISGRVQTLKGSYDAIANGKPDPGEKKPGEKPGEKRDAIQTLSEDGGPGAHAFTPEHQAELDVERALNDGDEQAAANVDRVLSSIQPGQELSREQDAYLTQMQKQQKGMSVEDLANARDRLGEHKNIMGDSWQLMSNDDVYYSGAGDDKHGTANQLPDSVQEALSNADSLELAGMAGEDGSSAPVSLRHSDELKAIAGIVNDGDPKFQTGTELDRQLIVAADRIMDTHESPMGDPPADLEETAQSLFGAIDDDHQIINDHLMGRNGVDVDDFLHDVNTIDWKDNGTAAGHLFSWTHESSDAHLSHERTIASETAEKYASYIGNHKQELMGVDGQTLGQLNPELVKGYAHGLTPYIPDIAGLSTAGDDNHVWVDFEPDAQLLDQPVAKGIFSVLSTDAEAYKEFHGAANAHALTASYSWAEDVKNGIAVSDTDPRLSDAQTLKGLSAVGTQQAADALGKNAHEMWEQQKDAYEVGQKIVTGGLGAIPGYGVVTGPSFDVFSTVMQDTIIGKEPTGTEYTIPPASKAECARFALNALLANDVPLVYGATDNFDPEKYFAEPSQSGTRAGDTGLDDDPYRPRPGYHPQIRDLPGLESQGEGPNIADHVLTQVLGATVPRDPAHPFDSTNPTQSMYDKYDQVTKNADPKIAEPPK